MRKVIVRVRHNNELREPFVRHSAKGSTWKDHKYIKKVGDKYVYTKTKNGEGDGTKIKTDEGVQTKLGEPVEAKSPGTSGTNPNNEKNKEKKEGEGVEKPEEFNLEEMANKVIRGEFGNGADRKELLGDAYGEIQKRVNEIMRGVAKKTSVSKKSVEAGKQAVSKIPSNVKVGSLQWEQTYH